MSDKRDNEYCVTASVNCIAESVQKYSDKNELSHELYIQNQIRLQSSNHYKNDLKHFTKFNGTTNKTGIFQ